MAEYSDVYTANAFTRIAMLEGENLRLKRQIKEYQDKIEQGLMIESPCKVGDTIYWISSNNRDIIEVFVKRIALAEQDRTILYVEEKGFGEYTIMFVDDIFLTREEAEAKLLELQNK